MEAKKQLIYLDDALDLIRDALEKGDRDLEEAIPLLKVLASHGGAVDAVEVVHGRWLIHKGHFHDYAECSLCGEDYGKDTAMAFNYCPECGAHMDGRSEGE